MAAIPEEATSMTNQREITDQENCPTETPPLVDPRYSVLRQEFTNTEIPTDDETQSQIQEENYPTVLDTTTSSEDKTHAIITAPPITDSNISESEDTLEETEEVFTQLSDSELLKAANEINISQTLINKKALELEDINTEMELEDNELGNKSCFSEGDCADEETRDYLDSIDTFDERNFTDKTLTDKINQLVAKSLAATKDSDVLIRGGEHNHINQNNLHATSHVNPRVGTPRFQSTPLPTRLIPPKPQPSIEIAQNQNDTPVVLNFTQPSVPDFPIFVPVPMDETPMNRYKPAYITTDNPLDEDSINEQMPGHNITMSRNCLTYKSDNYIHFISQDCGPYTKNSRLLSDIGAIDYKDIRSQKPSIGQILAVKYKSNYILLTVITARHSDPISGQKVREAMKNLKEFMITNKLNSARIARKGELTEPLTLLTEIVKETFKQTHINITLCYGQVDIPKEKDRKDIITDLHTSHTGGHKGISQTYAKIRERYYWTGMRNDIQNFVRKCPECQERKIARAKTRQPMLITDTPIEAFDKVSIDTVGKLRTTPEGNCHLLTMQCNLTKYLIAIPIPNLRATTIADALARHLICQFGAPRAILSDQGTSFLSDIVETLMRLFKIRHLTTSAYRPQTNGSLEKSHAPLIDFIRTYSENYDDWDKLAPFTTFAYNTSVHSATNFTPYELVYGKTARFPLNIPTEDRLPTYNIYLQDLITRLTEMKNLASDRQQNKKEITKKRYDKKARPFGGSAGDHAWVLNEPRVGKFDIYYKTPLLVKEILGNNTAILQLPTGQLIRKHLDKLKAVPQ
ncbi:hypothetical protein TKK_0011610 [Trichogramma kaykai]|uniref:RNA-directed DNA polymerase n=1 Tax=Trichogramma kaykai TaxID=54128 RepID=A0ABD2WQH3_9HYME